VGTGALSHVQNIFMIEIYLPLVPKIIALFSGVFIHGNQKEQ